MTTSLERTGLSPGARLPNWVRKPDDWYSPFKDVTKLGILGDSLARNGFVTTGSTYISFAGDGFITWMVAHLQGGVELTGNYAQGGKTSEQIEAELLPLCLAGDERHIVVCAGMNDVIQGFEKDRTMRCIRRIVNKLLDAKKIPLLTTIPARLNAAAATDGALWSALNRDIAALARSIGQTPIDLGAVTLDPASTKFDSEASGRFDANHINNVNAYFGGKHAALVTRHLFRRQIILPRSQSESWSVSPTQNLLNNPMLLTTGGTAGVGVNGKAAAGADAGVPLEFTVERGAGTPTVVSSLEPYVDPETNDIVGNVLKLVITANAAGDRIDIRSNELTARVNANLLATYRGVAGVKLESPVNVSAVQLRLGLDSGNGASVNWGYNANAAGNLPEGFDVPAMTPRMRPAAALNGTTLNALRCSVLFSAAGSATLYFRHPAVQPS